jgi:DNA polymerase III epsilon subunit-like protein
MLAKFNQYNTHDMMSRFKSKLADLNAHPMKTRTKTSQMKELDLFDMDKLPTFEPPKKSSCVLIFDTETTGLIPKGMPPLHTISNINLEPYPYITQLSAILYDVDNGKIKSILNTYIKIPDHVEIPEIVVNLTGITREKCDGGMNIADALEKFYKMYSKCEAVIAHNMWFDSKMIRIECRRNLITKMLKMFYKEDNPVHVNCTMMQGMKYCGLNRFVRLSALYELLFKEDINSYGIQLHNSLVDTLVCLRCYLKIFCEKELTTEAFTAYLVSSGVKK